jgi:hypothetical protein
MRPCIPSLALPNNKNKIKKPEIMSQLKTDENSVLMSVERT